MRGNMLEAPCKYIIKGPKSMITNIECMIKEWFRVNKLLEFILSFTYFFVMLWPFLDGLRAHAGSSV